VQRQHLKTAKRAAGREVPLPQESSLLLAEQLLAAGPTPSQQVAKRELARRLRSALSELPSAQREVLLMRNFEGLSYQEVAYILDIDATAARKRYGRALLQLRKRLLEGGLRESEL
jgi:RNA polymerase sigma-70 factor (ECF subfamily)